MDRYFEIGLGIMFALVVVVNGAQATPRDGRFVPKNHPAEAAPARFRAVARGHAAPVGRTYGATHQGFSFDRAYGNVGPAYGYGAARGWGYATGPAYGPAVAPLYTAPPPYGSPVGPGVGTATGRASGYAGAPPYGATPGPAYAAGPAYGYAGEPGNAYAAVPSRGYAAPDQSFAAPVYGYGAPPACCPAAGPVYGYVTAPRYNSPYPPDPIFGYYPVLEPW